MGNDPFFSLQDTDPSVNPAIYLTDVSKQDKPWDSHKMNIVDIANALAIAPPDLRKRSGNVQDCAEQLYYAMTNDVDKPFRLRKAWFCRDRACTMCQWRRSLKWLAVSHQTMPRITELYPKHRWVYVTLTVRNCEITELRDTITELNRMFTALVRKLKKNFGKHGYIKSVEVTRAKDDTAHPHLHVAFLVEADYFRGSKYVSRQTLAEMWASVGKLDYYPQTDIRALKPKKGKTQAQTISEVIKYSVKSSDLLQKDKKPIDDTRAKGTLTGNGNDWLYEYLRQTKGLRFLAIGGILKGLFKADLDDADLVHINDDCVADADTDADTDDENLVMFAFDRNVKRYKI